MNVEEALIIASKNRSDLNQVVEYANGYVFSNTDDINYTGGMGHSAVVVLKKTGKIIDMPHFVMSGTGKEIRRKRL